MGYGDDGVYVVILCNDYYIYIYECIRFQRLLIIPKRFFKDYDKAKLKHPYKFAN